jgi:hypothetical protein
MKDGLEITCKKHSLVLFTVLCMHFPGGNKEEQANSVITINLDAAKKNFWLPWVLIILLRINFFFTSTGRNSPVWGVWRLV